jgi:hypothetical protein
MIPRSSGTSWFFDKLEEVFRIGSLNECESDASATIAVNVWNESKNGRSEEN